MIFLARILLHRGNLDGARAVMNKIYAHATAEQLDLKVRIFQVRSACDIDLVGYVGQSS
jgi:hypothetical protein